MGSYTEAKALMVSVGVHTTHSWIWTSADNMIKAVYIVTQRASSIGGRPIESDGMLLCVDCASERVADFFVNKLIVWVLRFNVGGGIGWKYKLILTGPANPRPLCSPEKGLGNSRQNGLPAGPQPSVPALLDPIGVPPPYQEGLDFLK
eukprot:997307-Pelagomonas_calceolata.AAC.1